MDEQFGPEYLRPAQPDCPRCDCCTAVLCEKGRNSVLRCGGHVSDGLRDTVRGCPCSAETTKRTAAWRVAQVRVTRLARELPLGLEAEGLLRLLVDGKTGEAAEKPDELVTELKLRGLAQVVHGMPAITALGHTYLHARADVRGWTAVQITDIDKQARTATVAVPSWRPDEQVTVLLDQVLSDSQVDIDSLHGRWLVAEANSLAEDADRLVLTQFRVSPPMPPIRTGGTE
ncbi:hypothetical protein [Streptomyces sp. NPDC058548]|uniref:hypothetical protein n=1 Tax=Streptomyces sp. NPDC058548 TaxID=3346545 RepID=UPI00364D0821